MATALAAVTPHAGQPAPTSALEEARSWLARELHDGAVQRLSILVVEAEQLRRRSAPDERLDRICELACAAIADLRRAITELRDEPSTDTRFVESVRSLVDEFSSLSGIEAVVVAGPLPNELPTFVTTNLRRVVGEALNNVRRHSRAQTVTITVQTVDQCLVLLIRDNGRGLEFTEDGTGIRGMRERIRLLGGRMTIESTPDAGTTVHCAIPLAESQ